MVVKSLVLKIMPLNLALSTVSPSSPNNLFTKACRIGWSGINITFSVFSTGDESAWNNWVVAGYTFQTSHTSFFPRFQNEDTVSQPVKAWNPGRTSARLAPIKSMTSLISIYFILFCVFLFDTSKPITMSWSFHLVLQEQQQQLVLMNMLVWPFDTACSKFKNIHTTTSSC